MASKQLPAPNEEHVDVATDPNTGANHYEHDDSEQARLMGNEEQFYLKPELRRGDDAALTVAIVSAAVLVASTWAVVFSSDPIALGWFAFHPTLQTLAFFFFLWGVTTLQPTSQPRTKAAGLQRHQVAQILGITAIICGSLAMIINKASHGAPHFTSWHGTFGLITLIWLVLQFIVGAGSVWYGGKLFGGGQKAKQVYKYHRVSGYILVALMLFTIHLAGAWSTWMNNMSSHALRVIAYTVAPILIILAVYSRMRPSKMRFTRS